MAEPLSHQIRVRYAECDPQGVVFNSHYLAYFDIGITELWREALGSYQAMLDRGYDMVVASAQLRFHRPARFDDMLTLNVGITHLGETSIGTRYLLDRGSERLVEGMLWHVMVDPQKLRKIAIPDWLRHKLEPWTVG